MTLASLIIQAIVVAFGIATIVASALICIAIVRDFVDSVKRIFRVKK